MSEWIGFWLLYRGIPYFFYFTFKIGYESCGFHGKPCQTTRRLLSTLLEPTFFSHGNARGWWNGEVMPQAELGRGRHAFPPVLHYSTVQRRKCLSAKRPTSENVGRAYVGRRITRAEAERAERRVPAAVSATRIYGKTQSRRVARPEMGNYQTRFSYFLRSSVGVRGHFLRPRSSRMWG